jgi:hypothetical protein
MQHSSTKPAATAVDKYSYVKGLSRAIQEALTISTPKRRPIGIRQEWREKPGVQQWQLTSGPTVKTLVDRMVSSEE